MILKGTVRSWVEREEAERAAWSAPGVTKVEDRIVVAYSPRILSAAASSRIVLDATAPRPRRCQEYVGSIVWTVLQPSSEQGDPSWPRQLVSISERPIRASP